MGSSGVGSHLPGNQCLGKTGQVSTYAASSGSISEVVKPKNVTTTTLTPSANPIAAGQLLTLVATVAGSFPTGTIQFTDGGANLGSAVQIVNGQATYSSSLVAVGGHAYGASYAGDPTNTASAGSTVVNVTGNSTRTLLQVSPVAATPASQVSLNATIYTNGGALTGTVTFKDGATVLQTVVLSGSHATWAQAFSLGQHSITASFSGDTSSDPSASSPGVLQVSSDGSVPSNYAQNVFEYDAQGNLKKVTDPNGAVTQTGYDSLARATTVTQPIPASGQAAPTIGLNYDLQDQTTKVIDPRNLSTTYSVDGLGNASAQSSPDTGATNRTFYDSGLLKTSTDARNKTTTYTYDAIDRLKTVAYNDGGTGITYNYDEGVNGKGHLTSLTDESGATTLTYDGFGHIATKTQVSGPTGAQKTFGLIYTWGTSGTASGKLQSITYPSGAKVTYGFDLAGHIKTVTVLGADSVTTQVLTGLAYTPLGQPKSWAWGSGVSYLRSFDDFGRLSSYPLGNPNGSGISAGVRRTLSFDAGGRIAGYSHSTPAKWDQLFGYDGLDRLISANLLQGNTYGYSYDATGNRTQATINGTPYALTVSATSNRYTNVATAAGGSTVQGYDAAGNLASDAGGTYTFSGRGRLKSQLRSGNSFSYLYNAFEQRVYKGGPTSVITTGVAYYVFDDFGHLIGEYDATGKAVYETVYVRDMPVAALTAPAIGQTTVSYIYADHLNTARVIVRPSDQGILWQWGSNEPFGQTQANSNPNGLGVYTYNPRFPGQVADTESGWFYNWNRDYNPVIGRYVQSDPLGMRGGLDTYSYVKGRPIMSMDPTGLVDYTEQQTQDLLQQAHNSATSDPIGSLESIR